MKKRIILASTSPRRKELAQGMGLEFDVIPSKYEEDMTLKMSASQLVKTLSYGKAKEVAERIKSGIVIGVDTIVVFKGKKLGKPKNEKDAFGMLKSFSGKWQEVYSGVAIIDCKTGKEIRDYEVTKVKFRKMSDDEIWRYIKTGDPMDKGGAYGIQGLSSIFIERVEGCYFNVVGFPVYNVYKNLKKVGVNIFEYEKWRGK